MSYVYGLEKNKYVVFGTVLAIFLISIYLNNGNARPLGIVVIISGVIILMMVVRAIISRKWEF
jgi:hypothetical protein